MKQIRKSGNFFLCVLLNVIFNLGWTIPAWILLALHYILHWPILWFWLALGIWLLGIMLWMCIMRWAARCGSIPDKPKENKNPYSKKNQDMVSDP